MQRRNIHLFILLAALLFLMAVIIFWYSHSASTLRATDSDFSLDRSLEILRIEMYNSDRSEEVIMEKDEQGRWKLNRQLFANDLAVQQLISSMARLRVRQPVSFENRNQVDQMLDEHGITVKFFVQAWRIHLANFRLFPYQRAYQSFVVGEDTPDGLSTYMRKSGSQMPFKVHIPALESGIAYLFEPYEKEWRNPVIIDMERQQISRISVKDINQPGQSYHLMRINTGRFEFFDYDDPTQKINVSVDSLRLERFLSAFRNVHYETLLDDEQEQLRKKLIFEQPFLKVSVQNREGMEVSVLAFARHLPEIAEATANGLQRDPNRLYIQVNDGEFALAQYYVFSRILRPLSFFEN
jgi:hypothetical protein